MPFDGQQFGGKSKEPLLPLTSSTASPSVSKQPKSTTPLESTGEKSKGKTGSEAPLKQDGTPFVPIIPNLEIGKPWKEKTNTKEFELPKQYTSEKPYIEADIQTRQALDALPAYSRSVIGNGSFKRDFAEYLKQNPKDAQKMITWKGGDVKAQAEQFDVLTKFYRQKAEPLILKLEEYDAKGVGAALEKANQVYVNLDKVQDELKKNQSQVNFYLNTYLEQNGYSDIVKQAKELKSKVNSFDAKSFSETEKSIKQELGAVEAEIQPLLVNGSIPQENYQQYLELKSRADSLVAEYNGLIQSPEVLEYSKNVADLNELIASQNELATGLQSNSQYKKAFSSYEAVSKKYTDLISQAQQFDDMKTDFKGYISTANQVSDITKKYDNISKGFPDVISRNELQKKIDILGEQGDATKAKSLGVLQSLPQSANSIFSGIGSALAKMDKVMQGADDKDYYSVYDKMSDYYDNLNKFNSFIVPSPKAIRKDGSLNWSELGYEALSQWGNMAIFASVGGYGKAPTVATAYFMSRKGREEEAEQAGLTGASKEAYVSTLSTLEGLSELIMPDNQLFTAPIKKLLLKEAVMAQSKGINWFRKRALAVVLENSGKEAAEEYVVKLGELMQKVASNYSNGNAFDLSEYKNVNEWLRTGLVAAPLAGLSSSVSQVNVPKKELEVARYEAAKNLTQARDILDDLVEGKKMTTEKADAEYKKIVNYAAVQSIIPKDISNNKAVELVPLLIENEKLKLQMENVDEVFKEGIKEKISANIEKAKEILNQKEEKIVEENIDALPESPMEVVKAEMPEEIANLNDDETIAISVNNINDVPEAYRDRVKEGELKGTAQKSFLGLFGYGKKVDVSKKTYSYTITGKEAKEEWLNQNIGEEKDAIKTKDEVSSGDTVARTDNTGAKDGDIASATDKGESGKGVVNQEEIERLRAQEQVEVDATDPNDQEKLDEIYNRYNELITPLLEGEKEVKYNIDEARQQFIKDNEIEAFQEKFGYEPYNPFESLPDGVYETILRVEDNTPTSLTAIEEASKWLYSQYKMLEAKKVADTRDMTIPQIDEVLSELEGTITELENFKNKLYEESGQAKGGQDTTPVQKVDGQTSEGVRVGKEVATPTQEVAKEEATEESKAEEIGSGLLSFLGIPLEVESKGAGVNVSNKSALSELEGKVKGDKKSIIEAAKKALATLKSVFPDMEIYIHEDPESYNETMSEVGGVENSRGNFAFERDANDNPTGKGRIDINLSIADNKTVAHEVSHGIMLKAFGDNPALFKNFRDKISKVITESSNKALMDFANQYVDKQGKLLDVTYEEYLAELTGALAAQQNKISPTTLQKIAALINEVVSKITNGKLKPFENTKDTKEVIEFFSSISKAIREGSAIEGVTEKINTSAKSTGIKIDTSSLKSKSSLIQNLGLQRFSDMGERITEGVTIKDLGDVESHLTFSDRLVTGKVGDKDYLGGILFAAATNRVWASFTKTRVSQIISGMPKNKDGYRYLMPALLTDIAHMSNKDMSNTAIRLVEDAISKGEISPLEADERISKALSRKGLEKFFELYSNTIGKNKVTPKIIISAIDNALVKSSTTFDERNAFLESLLGKADIDLKKRFGTLPSYNVLANGLAEPITNGHDFGDILLAIRTKGDLIAVQPKEGDSDYHPSYPWVIRSVKPDGSMAEVETLIFKESYSAIDVFPEVTNKQGQKYTYQQYVDKYGGGAKSRYLGYMGARSTMSTSVTEKIVSEAQPKATIASKSQRVDKASDKLKELFQRDNIPLTIAEAKTIVEEVYDWTTWYDGLTTYVYDIFGEYSEDVLSMLPLASMAANSSATVGLAINNAEKIYRGEKPSGVAEYYGYVTDFLEGKGIKSDKMSEFFKALTGNKDAIAVDMHVYSIIMGKNPNKKQVNPSNKQEFDKAKEFVRTLASELDLAPREVQAALWAANILRTGGRPDSYEQYFKKQIDGKGLKERIENWRNKGYKPFSEIRKDAEASAKKEGATISSKSQKAQNEKIKEYIDAQRKAGQTDKNIRAGIELIADRLGLSALDIDNLMDAEKIENSKKAFEFWLNLESDKEQFIVSTKIKSEAAKAGIDEKALKNAAKTMKNISEIREKLLNAKVIETIDCKWG
jgi:hypothetical protein